MLSNISSFFMLIGMDMAYRYHPMVSQLPLEHTLRSPGIKASFKSFTMMAHHGRKLEVLFSDLGTASEWI